MKKRFIKNLYSSIGITSFTIFFLVIMIVSAIFARNDVATLSLFLGVMGLILIIAIPSIIHESSYFIEIGEKGIQVFHFKKIIDNILWSEVKKVSLQTGFRTVRIKIELKDDSYIALDNRKAILHSLEYYGDTTIQNELMNLFADDYEGKENNLF